MNREREGGRKAYIARAIHQSRDFVEKVAFKPRPKGYVRRKKQMCWC